MVIGVLAALLGATLHLLSTGREDPARPSRWDRRRQGAGWIASIVGALALGDVVWDARPGLSIVIVVAVIVLVNGLPSLIVAILHTRCAPS